MAYAQSPITLPTNYGTRKHKTQCKTLCFLAHFIEKKEETVRKSESLYSPTDSLGPSSIARNIPAPFPASSSYIYVYTKTQWLLIQILFSHEMVCPLFRVPLN